MSIRMIKIAGIRRRRSRLLLIVGARSLGHLRRRKLLHLLAKTR